MLLVNKAKGIDYYLLKLLAKRYRLLPSDVTCEQSKATDCCPLTLLVNKAKRADCCPVTRLSHKAKRLTFAVTRCVNKAKRTELPCEVASEESKGNRLLSCH